MGIIIIIIDLFSTFSDVSSNQNYRKGAPEDKMDFHSLVGIDGQLTYQHKTNMTSFFELNKME